MTNVKTQQLIAQAKKVLAQADLDLAKTKAALESNHKRHIEIESRIAANQRKIDDQIIDLYAEIASI